MPAFSAALFLLVCERVVEEWIRKNGGSKFRTYTVRSSSAQTSFNLGVTATKRGG
jgi:hypothetical protein